MPALPTRVGEPLGDLQSLVGAEVVEDDVDLEGSGDTGIDSLEELEDIDGRCGLYGRHLGPEGCNPARPLPPLGIIGDPNSVFRTHSSGP